MTMLTVETERLMLRSFTPDDWQELQELAIAYQATESAKFEDPWPNSAEAVKGFAEWLARTEEYLAVCLKPTGRLIGFIAIERRKEHAGRLHNLGYVFHPGYSGQGYATEGCSAAMGYIFGPLAAEGIVTGTRPENTPSVALLKRLGLRATDNCEWVMSREEWLESLHDNRSNA
jgi:RimJ/RimL family protein N-acetyltransferase